jgi:hypothetical protein
MIDGVGPELAYTEATARTLGFLRRPPLPAAARAGYQVLFAAASSTLRPEHRRLLKLPDPGTRIPRAAASVLLGTLRAVLSDGPPAAAAARRRLRTVNEPVTETGNEAGSETGSKTGSRTGDELVG